MPEKRLNILFEILLIKSYFKSDILITEYNHVKYSITNEEAEKWILEEGSEYASYTIIKVYEKTEDRMVRSVRKRKNSKSDS